MINDAAPSSFFRKPISAWLIAFGGTAIGIWLEFHSERIESLTGILWAQLRAGDLGHGYVAWEGIGFWVACIAWATMVYLRLRKDDDVSEDRVRELTRAINRAPDASVVINYPTLYFQPCIEVLRPVCVTSLPSEHAKKVLADKIVKALKCIAQMAKHFAGQHEADYGANIMLAATPDQFSLIRATMNLKFHDPNELVTLRAILYSREALCVASCAEELKPRRVVPAIAVPVPRAEVLAIPGAPRAFLSGKPGVHSDAWSLHEDCSDLAKPVRDEIGQFFSAHGAGKHIRSFASFRLGTEGASPIGILNIDSNTCGVLGPEPNYYPTFHALLVPIMAALAQNVQEYARLDFASLEEIAAAKVINQ